MFSRGYYTSLKDFGKGEGLSPLRQHEADPMGARQEAACVHLEAMMRRKKRNEGGS